MRKMGSALSTSRMCLRLINWLDGLKFFIKQIQNAVKGEKLCHNIKEWVMACCEIIGGIADNWFFLCRVSSALYCFIEQLVLLILLLALCRLAHSNGQVSDKRR